MADRKTIHDPIHGSIAIDGVFTELLDRHEMQRLRSVKQLGMGFLVFPGANHTRFEHSLGVYHLSKRMCGAIDMDAEETETVAAAGMLHDICHAPFSHTLEELMELATGKNHMEIAKDLIFGNIPNCRKRDDGLFGNAEPISEILEESGISAEQVCDLISLPESDLGKLHKASQSYFSSKDYMHQIIHGPVDADQMDYLLRDAHYTGVKLGTIDLDRILSNIVRHNDKLVLKKSVIPAAEGLMVSRMLMYSSVYFHKTSHMAEMMLTKAVEEVMEQGGDFSELYLMTDGDLIYRLISCGGRASEMARSILARRIYKKSFSIGSSDADDDTVSELTKYVPYRKRKMLEEKIASRAGVDKSHVIVEIPPKSVLLSYTKIGKTDVPILDGGSVRSLASISPIAKSIQQCRPFDWVVRVSCPEDEKDAVGKAAKGIIG